MTHPTHQQQKKIEFKHKKIEKTDHNDLVQTKINKKRQTTLTDPL